MSLLPPPPSSALVLHRGQRFGGMRGGCVGTNEGLTHKNPSQSPQSSGIETWGGRMSTRVDETRERGSAPQGCGQGAHL